MCLWIKILRDDTETEAIEQFWKVTCDEFIPEVEFRWFETVTIQMKSIVHAGRSDLKLHRPQWAPASNESYWKVSLSWKGWFYLLNMGMKFVAIQKEGTKKNLILVLFTVLYKMVLTSSLRMKS